MKTDKWIEIFVSSCPDNYKSNSIALWHIHKYIYIFFEIRNAKSKVYL